MRKKLTKTGNSHALIIPPTFMDILNIDKNTELEVTINDGKLIVFPIKTQYDWNQVQLEDETVSKIELDSMIRGEKDIKAGRVVDAEEVWKKLGI